jgi:hypothetical protein
MIKSLLIVALLALSPCTAQPTQPAANAADAYRAAWAKVDQDVNMASAHVLFRAEGPALEEGSPYGSLAEAIAVLEKHKGIAEALVAAAGAKTCDFRYRFDPKNPEEGAAIHELGKLRSGARLLKSDAARLWGAGDKDAAVARVEALYRMVGQLSDEPVVVVSLIGGAVLDLALVTTKTMVEGGLTDAQKARLLAAIDALDRKDPAGFEQAKAAEKTRDPQIVAKMDSTRLKTTSEVARVRRQLGAP